MTRHECVIMVGRLEHSGLDSICGCVSNWMGPMCEAFVFSVSGFNSLKMIDLRPSNIIWICYTAYRQLETTIATNVMDSPSVKNLSLDGRFILIHCSRQMIVNCYSYADIVVEVDFKMNKISINEKQIIAKKSICKSDFTTAAPTV